MMPRAIPPCAPPPGGSSRSSSNQSVEQTAHGLVAVRVVRVPRKVEKERAAERLGGDLEPLDGDGGRSEALAAHAHYAAAWVLGVRPHVAQEVEHARVVEVHADEHEIEAVILQ